MELRKFPVTWVKRHSFRRMGWWFFFWLGLSEIGVLAEDSLLLGSGILWSSIQEFWPGYFAVTSSLALACFGYSYLEEPGWIGLSSQGIRFGRRGRPPTPWSEIVEVRRAKLGGVILKTRRSGAFVGQFRFLRVDAAQFKAMTDYPFCPDRLRTVF
jgi:hypothetical protein